MRLYEYISDKSEIMAREDDATLDEILTLVERDCKKFIKETAGFLFRATNRQLGTPIKKMKQRTNRRPVDTSRRVHEMADKAFQKKFGWKVRSEGLFTATRPSMTEGYGMNRYLVFPIGDFDYVWSEEHYDFFISQSELHSRVKRELGKPNAKLEQKHVNELIDEYTDKNLKKAFRDRMAREVVLRCPNGYYYVNTLAIGELSYYLGIERY